MGKLIEKHQQSNGKGRGVLQFSPEDLAYIQSQLNFNPVMNTTSNTSVQQANQRVRLQKEVDKKVKDGNKRIADKHAHRAVQERDQRRHTPNVDVTKGYFSGTIQDANKTALNRAFSWYGLSNGLGQMTNLSDQMRNTPQFGNQMGQLYMDMAKVGLGTAIAPTLMPGGSFWTKGIQWLNPSKYFGKGSYSTALGGENASLLGTIADNALASYGATEALQHFYNNPDLQSGTMAVLAGAPIVTISPAQLEYYLNSGRIKKWEDLTKYMNGESARWLFNKFQEIKKTGLPFNSNRLKGKKELERWNTIFKVASEGLKGKKGVKQLLDEVKVKDPLEEKLTAIRNRIARINKETGEKETYWDIINKSAEQTGINWSDDAINNPGSYMTGMDTELKLKPVGFDKETPFIQRYYDNVVNHILNSGFQDKILKSGDLRRTADGKHWEGKWPDGTWNMVRRPEEYIKMRYAQEVKHANVELPKPVIHEGEIFDMMPMHGAGLGENNKPISKEQNNWLEYLRKPSTAPGKNGYWTIIRDWLAKQSHATGHYQQKNYSVPFYRMPKYEYDEPFKPGNSYGLMDLMKGSYSGKIMQPRSVQDGVPGIVNEYNFGPTFDHNPKSLWNTLDFEPGAGPMAYIEQKNNNKNNYA